MNIVLVIFDSLRKDCIGAYGAPPWWKVHTPNLDRLASEAVVFDRVYPESLPTLPARRAIYTGKRVFPGSIYRLKGDFVGAPGWGPIPEEDDTLAELFHQAGYRTALISDLYHEFKPSKNFWRGFDQWTFLRGQETDPYLSGPQASQEEIDHWLAPELQNPERVRFLASCLRNMRGREKEEDYFAPRVFIEASHWLQQNRDAGKFFLTVECFDPHEPWFVPEYYRKMYDPGDGQEHVLSFYGSSAQMNGDLLRRARANYSGLVTLCDRWFGYFYEILRVMGRLEDTAVIVVADHGHSIGDGEYIGKRDLPSAPEVFEIPLMIRLPGGEQGGERSSLVLQHHDLPAQILEFAGINPAKPLDGRPFWKSAWNGGKPLHDHVTVGFANAVTVIEGRWWFNCLVDGRNVILHDLESADPFASNVAEAHGGEVRRLWSLALADAGGQFPAELVEFARSHPDLPGCSDLAAFERKKA